jgi:hypothetical protein|tara:strand:+ start:1420 stop:2424 length:1005 start_codon:yes stop_codon:yes gene_type:complete
MNSVYDTLLQHLPFKRKKTPSGWMAFNAPCCSHQGTTADSRQRGGLIANADGGISYHCFNCGYTASWQPGRNLSYKLRKLMRWLNTPDDVITKLALHVLKLKEETTGKAPIIQLPKFEKKALPEGAKRLQDWTDYKALEPTGLDENYVKVLEYLERRQLANLDYNFYWTPTSGYKDRVIIPFYYRSDVVGYTARKVVDGKVKYISDQQPGYVFNIDNQNDDREFVIAVEGPVDALSIDGVALLGSEVKQQQQILLNSLGKHVIVMPDRDEAGVKLVEQAIESGWSVSMPNWHSDVKDVNDAIIKYGRLHTLYSIVKFAEQSQLKIKLRMKKWFS